jgi:membrane protein DedA with SNARE-associated domain
VVFQHAGPFSVQHLAKRTSAYRRQVAFSKLSGTLLGEALRERGEVQEEVRTLIVIVVIIVLIALAYLLLSRRRR